MKAHLHAAWGLFLWLPAAVAEDPKVNHSTPVDPALFSQEPYRQNGMVFSAMGRGSGFVASHRNLFFTAAHVVYLEKAEEEGTNTTDYSGWLPPPTWEPAYREEGSDLPAGEIPSRGYFRWTLYKELADEYRVASNMAFSRDAVLAWGLQPFIDGSPAALDLRGAAKLREGAVSMITGYPASIPYTGDEGNELLHATTPEAIPYRLVRDSYVFADMISTGPGNSGGPVWTKNPDATWSASGILVSGLASETGIYGMSSSVKRLLQAAEPVLASPLKTTRHVNGVGMSDAVLTLPRAKTIPDGVKRWTRVVFNLNDFPEDGVVVEAKVNLHIDTEHQGDLIVLLVAPGGYSSTLHNQEGAGEDDLLLEDELVAFETGEEEGGEEAVIRANGRWQLLVQDRLRGDIATLDRFELFLSVYSKPES